MTIAFWCVLAAAGLPFLFAGAAKWSRRFDNHHPRDYLDALSGWRRRAHAAQLNSFEAFPLFASAVVINHLVAGANATANLLALAFVALRILFGVLYIADLATLRSLVWMAAVGCCVALFVTAA